MLGRYGTAIRVLTLNVLATTADFMSADRKAFKIAVWEALEGTKNQLFSCYMIAYQQKSISENKIHCCGGGIMHHTSLP